MNTHIKPASRREQGYALLIVTCTLAAMFLVLASNMNLASTEYKLSARNNFYTVALAAAEASTEVVIAKMNTDFKRMQNLEGQGKLSYYCNSTASAYQNYWPTKFNFSDAIGRKGQNSVEKLSASRSTNVIPDFAGLYGNVSAYRITSQAAVKDQAYDVSAAVSQDVDFVTVPIFQYAVFYNLDLEIKPGKDMTVSGKVHGNKDLIFNTSGLSGTNNLRFTDNVTYSGQLFLNGKNPIFPYKPRQVSSITVPIENNSSDPHQIVDPSNNGYYYKNADLIVTTTSAGVVVKTGAWNAGETIPHDVTINGVPSYSFITTTNSFTDKRENKPTILTEIDVAALNAWMQNVNTGGKINLNARNQLSHDINSIYVDDRRSTYGSLTAVRVVNGAKLPSSGLTVATQLPMYVKGHYNLNAGDQDPGEKDTSKTLPSSLVSDSITVLSGKWNDKTNSIRPLAENTTVNAAFLTGIVETKKSSSTTNYSGGLENLTRLLENWNNTTLTYNGSMVVLFNSKFATGSWATAYYTIPVRKWSFDLNFLDENKLPPCTPQCRKILRKKWQAVAIR